MFCCTDDFPLALAWGWTAGDFFFPSAGEADAVLGLTLEEPVDDAFARPTVGEESAGTAGMRSRFCTKL